MAQPADPIDQTLAELRIVIALRRNSAHLLPLVHSMLAELSLKIDTTLPTFPEEEGERDA